MEPTSGQRQFCSAVVDGSVLDVDSRRAVGNRGMWGLSAIFWWNITFEPFGGNGDFNVFVSELSSNSILSF